MYNVHNTSLKTHLPATPQLVNLIDQDQRVFSLGFLEGLDSLARHCSHISPPMTLEFGHVR